MNLIELNKAQKLKMLFLTEDGKEIFEGDSCAEVIPSKFTSHYYEKWLKYFGDDGKPLPHKLMFSTKEAADQYIDENKPIYSKKQVREALELLKPVVEITMVRVTPGVDLSEFNNYLGL